ncbi:hypothetical protein HK102_006775 [Quaeritorhiza haematococci]|nr:hypothetical protein HK102_006775 [Quaeritorhiza haematococci]
MALSPFFADPFGRGLAGFGVTPGWGGTWDQRRVGPGRVDWEWLPDVDLYEIENEVKMQIDLPGVKKEDVRIEFRDGNLIVAGERDKDESLFTEGFVRNQERNYGKFRRTISIPPGCDIDKIDAKFDNLGVLSITVPRTGTAEVHKITLS